ncbi:hypothetical protein FAF44_49355 [Nonomuraea sp. MG754425]|uniref:hypothetical protein n=1 Tax=Nonomuraea sp. MG754425 TaxID=2570319 RepID=UPI001F16BDAB|nr:hypothetical protein [Nonomuraea sp. MG754425]MCF6476297.1 hypothetical protein [Nonomuraea sp. MG754425]
MRQDLEAVRAELSQAREQHLAEAGRLREDLAVAGERLEELRGRLAEARADARAGEVLALLRRYG